jgi:hypothetical protein
MQDPQFTSNQGHRRGGEIRMVFVPFTPGSVDLHAGLTSASPRERRVALKELAGIGELLHEMVGVEEDAAASFVALPQEYQDWILCQLAQVVAGLQRGSQ